MKLVKITHDDDGEKIDSPKWCYISDWADAERTLCDGQAFGFGESSAVYKEKVVDKGGITCPKCMAIIKEIKAIKL